MPERIGGSKDFEYRYAWVRDADYAIKAFLRIDAQEVAKAAFSWLFQQIAADGARVLLSLMPRTAITIRLQQDMFRNRQARRASASARYRAPYAKQTFLPVCPQRRDTFRESDTPAWVTTAHRNR